MLHINRQNKTRKRHIGGGNRLIAAVTENNLPLVTQLLSQILDRSHVNSKGAGTKTPLIIAAENDFREIFTLLLRHGADPFIRDNSGKCVINYVSPDAADILLTHIETHGLMRQTLIALTELLTDAPVIFFQKFLDKFSVAIQDERPLVPTPTFCRPRETCDIRVPLDILGTWISQVDNQDVKIILFDLLITEPYIIGERARGIIVGSLFTNTTHPEFPKICANKMAPKRFMSGRRDFFNEIITANINGHIDDDIVSLLLQGYKPFDFVYDYVSQNRRVFPLSLIKIFLPILLHGVFMDLTHPDLRMQSFSQTWDIILKLLNQPPNFDILFEIMPSLTVHEKNEMLQYSIMESNKVGRGDLENIRYRILLDSGADYKWVLNKPEFKGRFNLYPSVKKYLIECIVATRKSGSDLVAVYEYFDTPGSFITKKNDLIHKIIHHNLFPSCTPAEKKKMLEYAILNCGLTGTDFDNIRFLLDSGADYKSLNAEAKKRISNNINLQTFLFDRIIKDYSGPDGTYGDITFLYLFLNDKLPIHIIRMRIDKIINIPGYFSSGSSARFIKKGSVVSIELEKAIAAHVANIIFELIAQNKFKAAVAWVYHDDRFNLNLHIIHNLVKKVFQSYLSRYNSPSNTPVFLKEIYTLLHDIVHVPDYFPVAVLNNCRGTYEFIKQFTENVAEVLESEKNEFSKTSLEDICLLRCYIGAPYDDWHTRLLAVPTLFIDYFGPIGENFLMALTSANSVHSDIRLPIIKALISKKININAVDSEGYTALHIAMFYNKTPSPTGTCDDIIVEELLAHPLLCPTIKDNLGRTAFDEGVGKWSDVFYATRAAQINVLEIKWQGLTRTWIEDLVSFYYNSTDGFLEPNSRIWCPSCFGKGTRPSNCDHVSDHNCMDLYAKKVKVYSVNGGIPPGYNGDLLEDGNLHCCAQCCEVKAHAPYCQYGCSRSYICNCPDHRAANAYKYYKLYKMIEKFAEFQDPKFFTRKFSAVWTEVTNYVANSIPYSREICVDFRTKVEATKIFIPEDILEKFPKILETEIYPSGVKAISVPNMRRMDDVIKNKLMPTIIKGPEKFNNINLGSYTKFIKLVHRQNIKPDFPIKIHEDRAVEPLCAYIKGDGFIDCQNKHRPNTAPGYCGAYLFPDELGVLVSSGDLDHDSYIAYRDKFMYNEILDFGSEAYPYFIGQSIKKPEVLPVRSVCEGGGATGGRRTVKRRTVQRRTVQRTRSKM